MSILNTILGFWDAIRKLSTGTQLSAVLYPYRKAYYDAKFAEGRSAGDRRGRRTRPSSSRGSSWRGIKTLLAPARSPQVRVGPPQAAGKALPIPYTFPGRVLAHRWLTPDMGSPNQQFVLTCENAIVQITILAPDLMRVRVSPTGRFSAPFSYALARDDDEWPAVECSVEETEEALIVRTSRLHCHVAKAHLRLTFLDPDGTVVNADAAGVGWQDDKVLCWKQMPLEEHIYGLGQKTTPLDKRGLALDMWNSDPACYDPGDDPIYSNIPFYLGLTEGRGYGIFYDHSTRSRFDFGAQTPGIAHFEAETARRVEGDELRYYFFYGPQLTTLLERYAELTGHMAMPPLWALGYHQNRWSYYPEARVREIAGQFRRRRIPCEAIHLDIDYMDGYRCFTWHPERFPDPAQLIADLHADGFKVVTMLDPGIKVDRGYWVCKEGLERGMFCTYPDGTLFSGPVWPGNCYFPDFTSPRVRAWWGELYQGLVDLGVDGFWNDMNEPAVFSLKTTTFSDAVQHEWEGRGADHRQAHNVYGMQMARATVEGLRKLRPGERPLVISRSVWAGTQRYNMHWLGDNRSDWPSLRNVMPLALNMGLSGIAFTGPDTGGFAGTPDGELLIRWNQMSVFTPFFRNHTATGTGDQEPWAFGEPCERISRKFIELRYRLLPYHYTAFWQSAQRGIPMMRPLFLPFQEDAHLTSVEDEFMFGDAFLVAPIVEPGGRSRRVYVPEGRWYDFWEDTLTAGPQIARWEAPLDRMPLLVRAGSIVPTWPLMQYTGQRPVDVLTLHVYPGDGAHAGTVPLTDVLCPRHREAWGSILYEDDGHTWAFQEGDYRLTRLRCQADQAKGSIQPGWLRIERVTEGRFTPPYERIRVAIHGLASAPQEVRVDGRRVAEAGFDPGAHLCAAHEPHLPRPPYAFETGPFHTIEVEM